MPALRSALYDTNILIDFANRRDGALTAMKAYDTRFISTITYIEFMVGVPAEMEGQAKTFLRDHFRVIHPDDHIVPLTVNLRRTLRLKLPDAMIYATAKSLGIPLMTRNTRDFTASEPDIIVPYE